MKGAKFRAFTLQATKGLLPALITPCEACAAFDPADHADHSGKLKPFKAIWDTGATASVISAKVVAECGLKPTGMKKVHGIHGAEVVETFLINIRLPQGVGFADVEVTLGKLRGADMLIGMDVITLGDFSITNYGGRTVFSFRVPSQGHVNFVEQSRRSQPKPKGGGGSPPKQFGKKKQKRRRRR